MHGERPVQFSETLGIAQKFSALTLVSNLARRRVNSGRFSDPSKARTTEGSSHSRHPLQISRSRQFFVPRGDGTSRSGHQNRLKSVIVSLSLIWTSLASGEDQENSEW